MVSPVHRFLNPPETPLSPCLCAALRLLGPGCQPKLAAISTPPGDVFENEDRELTGTGTKRPACLYQSAPKHLRRSPLFPMTLQMTHRWSPFSLMRKAEPHGALLVEGEHAEVWGGLPRAPGALSAPTAPTLACPTEMGWTSPLPLRGGLCSLGFWTSSTTFLLPYCHSRPNPPSSHRTRALEGGRAVSHPSLMKHQGYLGTITELST